MPLVFTKRAFLSVLTSFLLLSNFCYSQQKKEIKWLNIHEVEALMKNKPKKILIDVYTDWCGWCKTMDKKTYQNDDVVEIINRDFYAVKLNAETRDTITFNKKIYAYNANYKCNEFAAAILNGHMAYPNTIFLDEKLQLLTNLTGFINSDEFIPILNYFAENHYLSKKWEEYKSTLKKM
ncbi:DUF255 domain-containing protein [Solitalea sp. MAHUQ-68]|uniref:DUF255 domain-containing protein n=1 Tax=Solitalea agri TaxID=2953739 RepID=A0A9X2F597_9SPHI|nr:DUF255 domain-containing protein [Solitalea agri]MCO4294380.1 DUF255 domain-containing protein [Solitalea agri]